MTQDEIIEMAKQAHQKLVTEVYVGHMGELDPWTIELLKIFANLVAQHEREASALACDDVGDFMLSQDYADAIRARGQA
jgi:hypothetical protein